MELHDPVYTTRDYLDSKFESLDDRLIGIDGRLNRIEETLTGNRIELAKSGSIAAVLIALTEMVRHGMNR